MDELLNDAIPFEGKKMLTFEALIDALQSTNQNDLTQATEALEAMDASTNFWIHTKSIIGNSANPRTIFYTLRALKNAISKKWAVVDETLKGQVRQFALETMLDWCKIDKPSGHVKLCIEEINSVIVELIKNEWRTTWKTALSDLIRAAYSDERVCANCLKILKELSGELFDSDRKNLPSEAIETLKTEFVNEFQSVLGLCVSVCRSGISTPGSVSQDTLSSCVKTLHSFLSWMPPGLVLANDLIDGILAPLLNEKKLFIDVLSCFEKVYRVELPKPNELDQSTLEGIKMKLVLQINRLIEVLESFYKLSESLEIKRIGLLKKEYKHLNSFNQITQGFATIFTNFFQTHYTWLPQWILSQSSFLEIVHRIKVALSYMAAFTEVKEPILFKNCVEFWLFYLKNIQPTLVKPASAPVLNMGGPSLEDISIEFKKAVSEMIMALVTRVPKPQEINIVIDEQGLPKKEELVDSENVMIYDSVREILRIYAVENFESIQAILSYKMNMQVNSLEFTYEGINSISWAVGCLGNLTGVPDGRKFYIKSLTSLLPLCSSRPSMQDKVVVASNIMHIVSQNSLYLQEIPSFMIIVVRKLLEFADERSDEIVEMACNTLIKIAKQLGSRFVVPVENPKAAESVLLIEEILEATPRVVSKMSMTRKIDFHEAVAYMIAAESDEQTKVGYIIKASGALEREWISALSGPQATSRASADALSLFLRIQSHFCSAIGYSYRLYFERWQEQIEIVYNGYRDHLMKMLSEVGSSVVGYADFKKLRGVRKDILVLFTNLTLAHKDHSDYFLKNYSVLFNNILVSFISEPAEIKEAQVFDLIAASLTVLDKASAELLLTSLPMLLEITLPMITQDFTSYPELRLSFFGLLRAVAVHCFEFFLKLEFEKIKTIINSLLWALRHETVNVHEVGIAAINAFLGNINNRPDLASSFYKSFFLPVFDEVLYVTTDRLHQNSFSEQASCLYTLMQVVNHLNFPLFSGKNQNIQELYTHTLEVMSAEFQNLTPTVHETELQKVFLAVSQQEKEFKAALRDYLINLNRFLGEAQQKANN